MGWIWIALGALFILGLAVGRSFERSQQKERLERVRREEQILGSLGPIAAAWVTGVLATEEADKAVRDADRLTRGTWDHWFALTDDERQKLGNDMLKVYADSDFREGQDALFQALNDTSRS